MERISVIGLGKLGSPIAACFASKGRTVIGLDVMPNAVEALNAHRAPVAETGLQDLIFANAERISATNDWNAAIAGSDISFVIVPTPSEPDGGFSSKFAVDAMEHIGAALKNKSEFHVVVLISTVMPGTSDQDIIPALERASGKKVGKDFGYCYSPALIALGSVIRDYLNPDLVMIGEADPRSGAILEALYASILDSKPIFHHAKPLEAELAKIGINTFITTKISFANMLGMIADKMGETMGGVDVDKVTTILGSDSRIGKKYLKAGGSYGGTCFPRDNRAFSRAAALLGVDTYIPQATDRTNREYIESIAAKAERAIAGAANRKVAIIGVSFKPNTEVVEEAMGLHLTERLIGKKIPVVIYDPLATATVKKTLAGISGADTPGAVSYADSPEACVREASVVIITNPYRLDMLTPALLQGKTIIDPWKTVPSAA